MSIDFERKYIYHIFLLSTIRSESETERVRRPNDREPALHSLVLQHQISAGAARGPVPIVHHSAGVFEAVLTTRQAC